MVGNKNEYSKKFQMVFGIGILFSFVLWIVFMINEGMESRQISIFFNRCGDFLADTANVIGYSKDLDPYNSPVNGMGEKGYPPLTYCLMYLLSKICNIDGDNFLAISFQPVFLMVYFLGTFFILLMIYELIQKHVCGSQMIKKIVALAICFNAPMIFSIERANTIVITLFLCTFFVFYYDSDSKILRELSFISLAIAAAFKLTPAVLGILLIYEKKWKEAIRTAIYGVIFVVGPFLFLKGGLSNIMLMYQNVHMNLDKYTSFEGCNLVAGINQFMCLFKGDAYMLGTGAQSLIRIITVLISGFLLIVSLFFHEKWKKVLAVITVLVILPSHSGVYCVIYFVPAIILFLNEASRKRDILYLICFMSIMSDVIWLGQVVFNFKYAVIGITVLLCTDAVKETLDLVRRAKNRKLENRRMK